MKKETIDELKNIAAENNGILRPFDVIEAARPENSPLHKYFDWDNDTAAEKYRLWQARQLIAVSVVYIGGEKSGKTTRLFVSLTPDRAAGGGYRNIEIVLKNKKTRQQLLDDARKDMEIFQTKYIELEELAGVFEAMRRVKKILIA